MHTVHCSKRIKHLAFLLIRMITKAFADAQAITFLCVGTVVPVRSPVTDRSSHCIWDSRAADVLGFSTASPLGRCLTKVPSFPTEAARPRGKSARVQLLHYYSRRSESVHSWLVGLADEYLIWCSCFLFNVHLFQWWQEQIVEVKARPPLVHSTAVYGNNIQY